MGENLDPSLSWVLGVGVRGLALRATTLLWEEGIRLASSTFEPRLHFSISLQFDYFHHIHILIVYHVSIIRRQVYWTWLFPELLLLTRTKCKRTFNRPWIRLQYHILIWVVINMQKSLDLSAHEGKQLGMEPTKMAFEANSLFL